MKELILILFSVRRSPKVFGRVPRMKNPPPPPPKKTVDK